MDSLIDQRPSALDGPATLDWAAVIFGGPVPLHIGVCLQNLAQATVGDGFLEKQAGIVESMLADHAELNPRVARNLDHLARGIEIRRHRLLYQNMFFGFRTDLQGLE